MEADTPSNSSTNPTPQKTPGGAVEPVKRAAVAKERFQTPDEPAGTRYEMRDPMAEVTYRSKTLPGIVAMADRIGSTRFTEVAEGGKRTPVVKIGDEWRRDGERPVVPEQATREPTQDKTRPLVTEEPQKAGKVPAMRLMPKAGLDQADGAAPMRAASAPDRLQPPSETRADPLAAAKIDADAERARRVASIESALQERYVIKRAPLTVGDVSLGRTEYRFRGDTSRLAFTESTFKLSTDMNSPSVARSMVDVAEARNWGSLRVSGNEDFKRLVWLEASVRGVKAIGYEPQPADLEMLKRQREERQVNRVEPVQDAKGTTAAPAEKASARGSGGRKAVLAAVEAVLVARGVPDKQREAVMAAATEKLGQRVKDGHAPKVKVYDPAVPSQRPAVVPTPEAQRTRERAAPVR